MCQGEKTMRFAGRSPEFDFQSTALLLVSAAAAMTLALSVAIADGAETTRINPLRSNQRTKTIPKVNPLTRKVDFFKILKSDKALVGPKLQIQQVMFQAEPRAEAEAQAPKKLPLLPVADDPTDDQVGEQETVKAVERTDGFPRTPIGQVTTNIGLPEGDVPNDYAATAFAQYSKDSHYLLPARGWETTPFQWDAPALCHRPLYFEEINLERYGYSVGLLQPGVSAAHFFGSVVALPYKTWAEPPHQCVYTLGHYRPGSCVPYRYHYPRFSPGAGLWQAGVVTGLIFLIP